MTYCLAWKTKRAVFLLADTSVTLNASLSARKYSSFGELQGMRGKETVTESLLKINVVAKNSAIAFSGDVDLANSIIDTLKTLIESGETPIPAFRAAICSNSPFSPSRTVSFLFASFEGNTPKLLHFDSLDPTVFSDSNDVVQIGSMGSYYPSFSEYMIRRFIDGTTKPENFLAAVTAIVQSYGIHSVLSQMYVGGAFFGLYVEQAGVYWQDDTTYVIYHENNDILDLGGLITVGVRDNVLFVSSSLISETKFISNRVSAPTIHNWIDLLSNEVLNILNTYQSEYYVFLSNKDRMITVVRTYGNLLNEYFQIRPLEPNKVAFFLHDKFYDSIREMNAEPIHDAIPFKFAWLHATNA